MAETIVYLDSSVALRTILDVPERERLQAWLQTPEMPFVSSRLLRTEATRWARRRACAERRMRPSNRAIFLQAELEETSS